MASVPKHITFLMFAAYIIAFELAFVNICGAVDSNETSSGQPRWLSFEGRRLLQGGNKKYDIVVAKDGSGKYSRISDALKAVPQNNNKRFVIYVKAGVYKENVKVGRLQRNVMMYGDGMDKTTVTGSRSNQGGVDTFDSATFSVEGDGFVARDMAFVNTAGPSSGPAVALSSAADRSVFYRCRIEGYQDTLFVINHRQFYRECHIYGTIDFIFGHGTAVIQNSRILVRKPKNGQENVIAAHKAFTPNAGIVIQSSTIEPEEDLGGAETFLARPWKGPSTIVYMQNKFSKSINGLKWNVAEQAGGGHALAQTSLLWAVYNNEGLADPGASNGSAKQSQAKIISLSQEAAKKYTVKSFIDGDQWLPATNINYEPGLNSRAADIDYAELCV